MQRRYLDTCVLRLAYEAKEDDRTIRALEELDREDSVFLYSKMLELELLPKPIKNKNAGEVEFFQGYFDSAEYVSCTEEALELAMSEGCKFGMGAVDAIHVGCATIGLADELVTAEKATKPLAQATTIKVRSIA